MISVANILIFIETTKEKSKKISPKRFLTLNDSKRP